MQIVKLQKENIDNLYEIYAQQFGSEAWTKQQVLDSFNNPSCHFYGIVENDIIVSFVSTLETLDDINILDIATKNSYKNKGYAKALMQHIINLKKEGQTISLEVKSKNIPAINLYESFGFKTLHVRKNYYKDGDNALCMFLM